MRLDAGVRTHQGLIRGNNEDYYLVDSERSVFAVADGMGGHRGGEVASKTAIESLRVSMARGTALPDAVSTANEAVIGRAEGDPELLGMGTTLTAIMPVGDNQILIGHVGDSRAYLLHDNTMTRVTDDHSLVEELVRDGRLTPEQAESHPQRAIVTRALGVEHDVEVDVYTITVVAGDRIVLCSDGLTTMVRERDVERISRAESDPQLAADALVDAANDAGGEDNITVLVVDVLEVDAPTAPDPSTLAAIDEPSAPLVAAAAAEAAPPVDEPKPEGTRLRTLRGAILVLIPLVVILGFAAAALGYYARNSYFVGVDNGEVVIFKGVPGGIVGWNPTVDQRTGRYVDDLAEDSRLTVENNERKGSLESARTFVASLELQTTTTTTSTSTTTPTTKARRPTTTTAPKRSTTNNP